MRSETEIRERLEQIEAQLANSSGHDQSHLIGQRNILEWVLEDDYGGDHGVQSDHWTGHSGGQRR